jgi:hypothetical protein
LSPRRLCHRPTPTVTGLLAELHACRVETMAPALERILIADEPQYAEL